MENRGRVPRTNALRVEVAFRVMDGVKLLLVLEAQKLLLHLWRGMTLIAIIRTSAPAAPRNQRFRQKACLKRETRHDRESNREPNFDLVSFFFIGGRTVHLVHHWYHAYRCLLFSFLFFFFAHPTYCLGTFSCSFLYVTRTRGRYKQALLPPPPSALSRGRVQHDLPSPTRVELCLPTL